MWGAISQQDQTRPDLLLDLAKQIDRRLRLDRRHNRTFQQTAPQRDNPARPALRPDHHGRALADPLFAKSPRK
jgi:hypothetical protein